MPGGVRYVSRVVPIGTLPYCLFCSTDGQVGHLRGTFPAAVRANLRATVPPKLLGLPYCDGGNAGPRRFAPLLPLSRRTGNRQNQLIPARKTLAANLDSIPPGHQLVTIIFSSAESAKGGRKGKRGAAPYPAVVIIHRGRKGSAVRLGGRAPAAPPLCL